MRLESARRAVSVVALATTVDGGGIPHRPPAYLNPILEPPACARAAGSISATSRAR